MSVENEQSNKGQNGQREGRRKSQKLQAVIAIVVLVAIFAVAFVGYGALSRNPATDAPYELSGDDGFGLPEAADIASCELMTASGEQAVLGDVLEGKPAVLNFWASWCPHCVNEMADYQRLYDEYGDRVQFIMVDVTQGSNQEYFAARDFVEDKGYTLPVYYDFGSDFSAVFSLRALPVSAVLSADGDAAMCHTGEIAYGSMKATLEAVLAE